MDSSPRRKDFGSRQPPYHRAPTCLLTPLELQSWLDRPEIAGQPPPARPAAGARFPPSPLPPPHRNGSLTTDWPAPRPIWRKSPRRSPASGATTERSTPHAFSSAALTCPSTRPGHSYISGTSAAFPLGLPPSSSTSYETPIVAATLAPEDISGNATRGARIGRCGDIVPMAPMPATRVPPRASRGPPAPPPLPPAVDCPDGQQSNPHRLALLFLSSAFTFAGGIGLRFWRDDFLAWDGAAYHPLPDGEVRAQLARFIADEFERLYRRELDEWVRQTGDKGHANAAAKGPGRGGAAAAASPRFAPRPLPVTGRLVSDVLQALASLVVVPTRQFPAQPAWLPPGPRESPRPKTHPNTMP